MDGISFYSLIAELIIRKKAYFIFNGTFYILFN